MWKQRGTNLPPLHLCEEEHRSLSGGRDRPERAHGGRRPGQLHRRRTGLRLGGGFPGGPHRLRHPPGHFQPKDTTTVEQATLLTLRAWQELSEQVGT